MFHSHLLFVFYSHTSPSFSLTVFFGSVRPLPPTILLSIETKLQRSDSSSYFLVHVRRHHPHRRHCS